MNPLDKARYGKTPAWREHKPMFLDWCKSYDQEVREMRELIEGAPSDEKQLRNEYEQLTGKRFRRAK